MNGTDFFALEKEVPGWVIDEPVVNWAYIAVVVITQGWLLGVALLQHVHRVEALARLLDHRSGAVHVNAYRLAPTLLRTALPQR